MKDRGIVTGANARYFPGVRMLAESAAMFGESIVVFDDGLEAGQVKQLESLGASIARLDARATALAPGKGPPIEVLKKPLYMSAVGWRLRLWIDADAAIVAPLDDVWAAVSESPLLTGDFMGAGRWGLNSGVVGLQGQRDREILRHWSRECMRLMNDQAAVEEMPLLDQDALLEVARSRSIPVSSDRRMNFPANGLDMSGRFKRRRYRTLDSIIVDHPQAIIVHWPANPKFWHPQTKANR